MQHFKFSVLFLFCLLAFAQNAQAQATLSVQGSIQKSTGAAIDDGDYAITFRLYDQASGGTLIWSETQDPVEIIGGVYSVTLGSVNPLTAPFDKTYYLGISVGSGAEHTPRSTLTSAPYALSLLGQDNKFPSTGNVGIGTTAPTTGLDANSSISTATVTTSAAAYTVLAADHVIFLDLAGAQAVTLPSAATFPRREIVLINKTSTAKTVSSYVDLAGAAATAIPANGMIELRSNGTEWRLATTFAPPAAGAAKAYVYGRGGSTNLTSATSSNFSWTEVSDNTNSFSSTTFTAPRTGVYSVQGTIVAITASNLFTPSSPFYAQVAAGGTCAMGASNQVIGIAIHPSGYTLLAVTFGSDIFMNAGETLFLSGYQGSNVSFGVAAFSVLTILEQ
jgi:hypothetical protein